VVLALEKDRAVDVDLRPLGIFLLISGAVVMGLAFVFPVAVTPDAVSTHDSLMAQIRGTPLPDMSDVATLDLIAKRAMIHASGGFAGAVLWAAGHLASRANDSGLKVSPSTGESNL